MKIRLTLHVAAPLLLVLMVSMPSIWASEDDGQEAPAGLPRKILKRRIMRARPLSNQTVELDEVEDVQAQEVDLGNPVQVEQLDGEQLVLSETRSSLPTGSTVIQQDIQGGTVDDAGWATEDPATIDPLSAEVDLRQRDSRRYGDEFYAGQGRRALMKKSMNMFPDEDDDRTDGAKLMVMQTVGSDGGGPSKKYIVASLDEMMDPRLIRGPGSDDQYVQMLSLPRSSPLDDGDGRISPTTYMYTAVHPSEPTFKENEVVYDKQFPPRKIMPGFVYKAVASPDRDGPEAKRAAASSDNNQQEARNRIVYQHLGDEDHFSASAAISQDLDRDVGSSYHGDSESRFGGLGNFFGVTGTTSQNVQLGLTFTVPFLQIPLTSMNSVFDGTGLAGLMSNINTSNILIVAALALGAIFVLPMIIYWLTGVNISAFSLGRSDDDGGIPMIGLINTVEEALREYDIDTRTCLARTMCNQYQSGIESEMETAERISRGILDNLARNQYVKKYIGDSRVSEAMNIGKSKKCDQKYPIDVCPWDKSAIIKIASKLLTSGNIDFASIAAAAAKVAAANLANGL